MTYVSSIFKNFTVFPTHHSTWLFDQYADSPMRFIHLVRLPIQREQAPICVTHTLSKLPKRCSYKTAYPLLGDCSYSKQFALRHF